LCIFYTTDLKNLLVQLKLDKIKMLPEVQPELKRDLQVSKKKEEHLAVIGPELITVQLSNSSNN
jgi:hypothetical protein